MSLQEDTLNKLRGHIQSFAGFSDAEKKVWTERIEILPPEYALCLLELFEKSPEEVLKIRDNAKEKEKILKTQDEAAWQKLLEKEKQQLDFLAKKE